jgi:hypothetical protein
VSEYCRKFKTMADGLADLGSPVEDWILVPNILWGLNQRFEHVGSIIRRYSPFPIFLKVRDDLLLEEIHMDSTDPSAAPLALYTNIAPPTVRPPSSTPSCPPSGGNSGHRNKNNNKNRNGGHSGGNNGRNNNGSGGHNSSSDQTPIPTASDGRTDTPWPTYSHPWQGHMTVYLGPVPTGQQHPQAFMTTLGPYPSPGFLPDQQQQQPLYQQAAPAPSPGWNPLGRRRLGPAIASLLLQHHGAPPTSDFSPRLGGRLRRDAPHHSASW